jgi:tetratricopeptide (TPR) repeat protein
MIMEQPDRVCSGLSNRLTDTGLFLFLGATAFALGYQELADPDFWWHLRAGQWILANGVVPRTDPFTFGSMGRPWIDLQWFFEMILATVFATGRVRSIVLMTAVVATGVLLVALMARDKRWPGWILAACWLPALMAMGARLVPRPELFSLLWMAVYLTVLRRSDAVPALIWLLPPVQVIWVNMHALFPIGPFILSAYLIDRLAWSIHEPAQSSEPKREIAKGRRLIHVWGATIAAYLACLVNPYGLQGVLFPLELLPKITAWGGMYKSYISEFMGLREYVQSQGAEAARRNVLILAECFLLWMLPLGFILPAAWRIGGRIGSRASSPSQVVGWLVALGLTVCLVLICVLQLLGGSTWMVPVLPAQLAPFGFVALGVLGAALSLKASKPALLLTLIGWGVAECAWIVWLRSHLFGPTIGVPIWLGPSGSSTLAYSTILLGALTACSLLRSGERPFRIALAVAFGYLALQSVRNIVLFGLASGFVLSWSLGSWVADLQVSMPFQRRGRWILFSASLVVRVTLLAIIGVVLLTIVSGLFFRSAGDRRQFGAHEAPLAYPHEAARFAGRSGLPDHALVFGLAHAGVYLFHNGPDRKPFIDSRLEVPTQSTFEAYVRLNRQLQMGGRGWSDVVRRMGNPLILLDHERNFDGEATLLADPEWRCVYYDSLASVFLSRRRHDLELEFPTVDFAARHFRVDVERTIAPEPWGVHEAHCLHRVASTLRVRSTPAPDSARSLQIILALLVGDPVREAIAADSSNASYWSLSGDCAWNLIGALKLMPPDPRGPWEPMRGLLPAQAAFFYRRTLEIDNRDSNARERLSHAFKALNLSDAQHSLDVQMHRAGETVVAEDASEAISRADPSRRPMEARAVLSTGSPDSDVDDLSRAISILLRDGRAEAAGHLLAEAENRGVRAAWETRDRVATTQLYLGRPATARRIWERSTDAPSPGLLLARIAASELATLDFSAAERAYQKALELDPGLGEAWIGLALLYTQRGDAAKAMTASSEGLRRRISPAQSTFLRLVETLADPSAPRS